MSPAPFHPAKTEITTNLKKTNRVSHSIKKTSSSSLAVNKPQQQHRQPVIIYTHSPKIIETHPKDFMALVQKLTGLSHGESEEREKGNQEKHNGSSNIPPPQYHHPPKQEPMDAMAVEDVVVQVQYPDKKEMAVCKEEEIETTSLMVTDENIINCGFSCMGELKSCFMAPPPPPPVMMEPPMIPYVRRLPMFAPTSSSAEFLCSSKPFLNYVDPLFF